MKTEPLILAQFGCGYWGPNLLRNFSSLPNCLVRYVVDASSERRAFVEGNFPKTTAVDSIEQVLSDPEVNGIIIATPAATHFDLARQALKAGKHVFVEKPLATKVSEVDELAACAKAKQLIVMTGHTFLYNAAVRYVKKMVEAHEDALLVAAKPELPRQEVVLRCKLGPEIHHHLEGREAFGLPFAFSFLLLLVVVGLAKPALDAVERVAQYLQQ
jgi:hypothetical protein